MEFNIWSSFGHRGERWMEVKLKYGIISANSLARWRASSLWTEEEGTCGLYEKGLYRRVCMVKTKNGVMGTRGRVVELRP